MLQQELISRAILKTKGRKVPEFYGLTETLSGPKEAPSSFSQWRPRIAAFWFALRRRRRTAGVNETTGPDRMPRNSMKVRSQATALSNKSTNRLRFVFEISGGIVTTRSSKSARRGCVLAHVIDLVDRFQVVRDSRPTPLEMVAP